MNFQEIVSIFSSREQATIIWILLLITMLFVWSIFNNKIRKSIKDVIISFFNKKIIISVFLFFVYVVLITFLLSKLPLWDKIYIKDITIWSLFNGLIIYLNSADRESNELYVKTILKNIFQISLVVEFLYNTFTFNIIIELLLLPFLFFIIICESYSKAKTRYDSSYKNIYKSFSIVNHIICIIIFIFTIIEFIVNHKSHNFQIDFISFLIPLIYTILIIPIVYFLGLYSKYDILFYRLFYNNNLSKKENIKRKIRIIKECGLSIKKTELFYREYCKTGYFNIDNKLFESFIYEFNVRYKLEINKYVCPTERIKKGSEKNG